MKNYGIMCELFFRRKKILPLQNNSRIVKDMQAYEFKAVVRNGLIHIPEQLSNEKLDNVRVILLADTLKRISEPRKNRFVAMRLKTNGFTFNREEIHER
jgi:hypothetical protein